MNDARCRWLIERARRTFELDLSGLTVLTEAATGAWSLTPFIAALAGAAQVDAATRNSVYGRAETVRRDTMERAARWGVQDRLAVHLDRDTAPVDRADIVMNVGFVRPLDAMFLRRLKSTAVIPLMWEPWEHRPEELDLTTCHALGLAVLGTNEHHPKLQIFDYIGHLVLKLLFSLEIEVLHSVVIVAGSGEWAQRTVETLRAAQARVEWVSSPGDARKSAVRRALQAADALVMVEPSRGRPLIGAGGWWMAEELSRLNPRLVIAHLCGAVDAAGLAVAGLRHAPEHVAPSGSMSLTTADLGPKPLIDLHTAGLKVAELLARARLDGCSAHEAEQRVLASSSLALGFSIELAEVRP